MFRPFVVMLLCIWGCAGICQKECQRPPKACHRGQSSGAVLVGGAVVHSGWQQITGSGLTLSEAILAAGIPAVSGDRYEWRSAPGEIPTEGQQSEKNNQAILKISELKKLLNNNTPSTVFGQVFTLVSRIQELIEDRDLRKTFITTSTSFMTDTATMDANVGSYVAGLESLEKELERPVARPSPAPSSQGALIPVNSNSLRYISLTRGRGAAAECYYFSYDHVMSGLPRDISLVPGDRISVIQEENLTFNHSGSKCAISLGGIVQSPGRYETFSNLQDLLGNPVAAPSVNVDKSSMCVVVRQISQGGMGVDILILPHSTAIASSNVKFRPGTSVLVAMEFQAPLLSHVVAASLVSPQGAPTMIENHVRPAGGELAYQHDQFSDGLRRSLSGLGRFLPLSQ